MGMYSVNLAIAKEESDAVGLTQIDCFKLHRVEDIIWIEAAFLQVGGSRRIPSLNSMTCLQ